MKIFKFIYLFFCVICLSGCTSSFPTKIVCPGTHRHHLQDFVLHNGKFYWSYANKIIITDANGTLENMVDTPYHIGGMCIANDYIYVGVNFAKFNVPNESDDYIYQYDLNLNLVKIYKINDLNCGVGGIAYNDNKFYVFGGANKKTKQLPIAQYSEDFKLEKIIELPFEESPDGIQTMKFAYGKIWLTTYPILTATHSTLVLDNNFKIVEKYNARFPYGMIPTNRKYGEFIVTHSKKDPNTFARFTAWATIENLTK